MIEYINEAIIECLTSRLNTAKEKLLKNNASTFKKRMNLSLDTTIAAEYA